MQHLFTTREAADGGIAGVDYRIVLSRKVKGGDTAHEEFVVHCKNEEDGSLFWGDYFTDFNNALQEYLNRCKKNGLSALPGGVNL